jgi:hypothetical protein
MFRRLASRLSPLVRRSIALLALVGFLAGTIGVPLPAPLALKDLSQPFPCLLRKCGCMNAAQCWRGCCCFTNKQKVAWAEAHNIELPQFVLAAAKREAQSCSGKKSCCGKAAGPAVAAVAAKKAANPWVVAVEARQCHGAAELWLSLGAVILTSEPELRPSLTFAGAISARDQQLMSLVHCPAAPPPRLQAVS